MSIIASELTYEINLNGMQVSNEESNGWKDIIGIHTRNGHHVQYVNEDGRIWAQQVHISHYLFVESKLRIARIEANDDAPLTAADVSLDILV